LHPANPNTVIAKYKARAGRGDRIAMQSSGTTGSETPK
jgi:hypothetical protein